LVYHISNLSMEGFRVRKEKIAVEIAGMRATKKPEATISPLIEDSSDADDHIESPSPPSRARTSSADSDDFNFDMGTENGPDAIKATELLIIDVREISSLFNDAVWSFEQTYLPYLKGSGLVDARMSDGAIRLVFELRRRRKKTSTLDSSTNDFDPSEWEPVLCLHDRTCSIGSVDLNMQGGTRLAWVVNKLASVFKGVLRDYVVRTILSILTEKSGWCVIRTNAVLLCRLPLDIHT
jgi:hypothetical protein